MCLGTDYIVYDVVVYDLDCRRLYIPWFRYWANVVHQIAAFLVTNLLLEPEMNGVSCSTGRQVRNQWAVTGIETKDLSGATSGEVNVLKSDLTI